MDKPRYRAHFGGPQPVPDDFFVDVIFRDGAVVTSVPARLLGPNPRSPSDWWKWEHKDHDNDIVAYKVSG